MAALPVAPVEVTDEELLARYERLILAESRKIAKSYSLSREDAEDIAQNSRLKLCLLPPDVRHADPYCRTTIYNSCRDSIRVMLRQTNGLLSILDEEDTSWRSNVASTFAPEPWTIREAALPPDDTREMTDVLSDHALAQRLFSLLSPEQILVVSHWYGLDGSDPVTSARSISRRTGIKEARVAEILRAALAKLRNEAAKVARTEVAA